MKPQDYGLIFYHGIRPLYFTSYEVVKEGQTEHIEATLATGGTIAVHPYYSKRQGRMIKAIEAVYRQPTVNLQEKSLST